MWDESTDWCVTLVECMTLFLLPFLKVPCAGGIVSHSTYSAYVLVLSINYCNHCLMLTARKHVSKCKNWVILLECSFFFSWVAGPEGENLLLLCSCTLTSDSSSAVNSQIGFTTGSFLFLAACLTFKSVGCKTFRGSVSLERNWSCKANDLANTFQTWTPAFL